MTLSQAINVAHSALTARQADLGVTSRNIANVGKEAYGRKTLLTSTNAIDGSIRINGVARSANDALLEQLLQNTASGAREGALFEGLNEIRNLVGETDQKISISHYFARFSEAIQQFSNSPSNEVRASDAVTRAHNLVDLLNQNADKLEEIRSNADQKINALVKDVNAQLDDLHRLQRIIERGSAAGRDVGDVVDDRERLLLSLSEKIGIRTDRGGNNGLVLLTDSGAVLYDKTPRKLSFETSTAFVAPDAGHDVYLDGQQVTGDGASGIRLRSGELAGLVSLRDKYAVTYQRQLNEVARSLIDIFKETDVRTTAQLAGAMPAPARQGLFINSVQNERAQYNSEGLTAEQFYKAKAVADYLDGATQMSGTAAPPANSGQKGAFVLAAVGAANALPSTANADIGAAIDLVKDKTAFTPASGQAALADAATLRGIAALARFFDGTQVATAGVALNAATRPNAMATSAVVTGFALAAASATAPAATPKSFQTTGNGLINAGDAVLARGAMGAIDGLAKAIKVNPLAKADGQQLRDGGFNTTVTAGPPPVTTNYYKRNVNNAAAFSGHLEKYVEALRAQRDFDPLTEVDDQSILGSFIDNSIAWLDQTRQFADQRVNADAVVVARTAEALSNNTGVNMDEELQKMFQIERSYGASAKLVSTADRLMEQLIGIVR